MVPSLSLYLNGMRFVAALLVFLYHAGFWSNLTVPVFGHLGQEAVIVFFVLSGFVIAYSAERRHPNATGYLVARFARLWSVVLPALLLTFVCDLVGQALDTAAYGDLQPLAFWKWPLVLLANSLFLNDVWYLDISPGTDGAFWSLSYEFWYYMLFCAAFYFRGLRRFILIAVAAGIAGPVILLAFPVWLVGVVLITPSNDIRRRLP